jgi:hypothetical protein
MTNKLDPEEKVSPEEILMSNVCTQEAIVNVLERKGLLSRKVVLEEIIRVRKVQK